MRRFADISVNRKMTLIILVISCIAILSASAIFIVGDLVSSRRALSQEVSTIAEIVGRNSAAAVVFDHQQAADEILSALSSKPNIDSALVLKPNMEVFASYARAHGDAGDHSRDSLRTSARHLARIAGRSAGQASIYDDYADVVRPITLDRETVGYVALRSDLRYLRDQLNLQLAVAFVATLISMLVAIVLSYSLQKVITRPIAHLVDVMERVTRDKAYATRARKRADDEFGVLIDGFNTMLEQIEANEHALAAQIRAEAANRAKTEFLANMSHELRTPLNAIIGFSEIMVRGEFGPLGSHRYESYATDIHNSGAHLLGIINDILDLTKAEAGKLTLEEGVVEPAAVITRSVRMLWAEAAAQEVKIAYRIPVDAPCLKADSRLVSQAVINLLTNAVKFTQEGGSVVVSVEPKADGGCAIAVEDTGIGIAAEDVPKIREPFVQVANAFTRSHEGTGLGLPLVEQIMNLHGGMLDIESELGKGTRVTIRFPASRVLPPAAKLSQPPEDISLRRGARAVSGLTAIAGPPLNTP